MPTARQGFVQIEAFFQMLDLHEIRLRPQDKLNLQKLCETRSNQIKYKDALARHRPKVPKIYDTTRPGISWPGRPAFVSYLLNEERPQGNVSMRIGGKSSQEGTQLTKKK